MEQTCCAATRVGRRFRSARSILARAVLTAAGAGMIVAPGAVLAQEQPAVDLNQVQPDPPPPPPPAEATPAVDTAPAAQPIDDGARYPVTRFLLQYRSEHPEHPAVEDLLNAKVTLGVTPDGYVAYREGLASVQIRIADVVEGTGGVFYRSALNAVARSFVEEMNRRGYIGIFIQLNPEDIDETTGEDLRAGRTTDLRMIIWMGVVKQVRTIASGERLQSLIESDPTSRVDSSDPVQRRIRDLSPVQPEDLIRKDELDNYTLRLNRHPGRRVDVAIAPGENPEEVVVDYLVTESKPWAIYAQVSNTGTESTSEWRERFGFEHNQLTGHDDILRLDYITGNFDASNAFTASYEFPLLSNVLRVRPYGNWNQFDASEVGVSALDFSGTSWNVGADATGTVWQHRESFLDVIGGARWSNVLIEDEFGGGGQDDFFIPYLGVRFTRLTEAAATFGAVTVETNLPDVAGTDIQEIQNLGRLEVDDSWVNMKFEAQHDFYLEPLLNPAGFRGESTTGTQSLAHEIGLSFKGQYAFDYRLIPNEEDVAGGLFTVRGYPQSVVAGDSVYIGSLEYRFHLPRSFSVSPEPGRIGARRISFLGDDFRWAPQTPFGRADWDLILKAFVDAGHTVNNEKLAGEFDETLIGTGVGIELQVRRNLSMRLEWGVAIEAVEDPANPVESGDSEIHFLITLLY